MKKRSFVNIIFAIFLAIILTACFRIQVESNDGGVVLVNNFYTSEGSRVENRNNDITVKETANYGIEFQPQFQTFFITLSGKDLLFSRSEMEKNLVSILGVTQTEACRLKVNVGVVYSVNPGASGIEYGLSFCPKGKPLPKNINDTQYKNNGVPSGA